MRGDPGEALSPYADAPAMTEDMAGKPAPGNRAGTPDGSRWAGWAENRPKANGLKAIVMIEITQDTATQTHGDYPLIVQWLRVARSANFGKK
jgi:hypothetical protein